MTKILIFEDEKMMADMMVTKFQLEGFEAKAYYDGSNVVRHVVDEKPDFIIMSVIMPKVNGFEATRQLKFDQRTKDIPLAMWTSLGQDADVIKGKELGAVDYWIKAHYMPAEIVNKVRQHLHIPIPPEKPVPPPGEPWHGPSVQDQLSQAKPPKKSWWQRLFS